MLHSAGGVPIAGPYLYSRQCRVGIVMKHRLSLAIWLMLLLPGGMAGAETPVVVQDAKVLTVGHKGRG